MAKNTTTSAAAPRKRRTPEQAREEILSAAENNLIKDGIEGLRIEALSEATGMRHSNVIHHFGSADAVKSALMVRISKRLIDEIDNLLRDADPSGVNTTKMVERTFAAFSKPEITALVAWHLLSGKAEPIEDLAGPLTQLSQTMRERFHAFGFEEQATTENISGLINMVMSCAIGAAINQRITPYAIRKPMKDNQIRDWMTELTLIKSGLSEAEE